MFTLSCGSFDAVCGFLELGTALEADVFQARFGFARNDHSRGKMKRRRINDPMCTPGAKALQYTVVSANFVTRPVAAALLFCTTRVCLGFPV